jgi:hypothetical protein
MCTVFAHKKHDVASTGIPGALLHVRNDDYVIMCLNGILTELMVKVEPFICCPFVIANATGKLVLYVKLQKALYGMLKVGCFFYRKLVVDLTSIEFTLNPYDPCVANKSGNVK